MPSKRELAWEMRRHMTKAEALLWHHVRNNQLEGLHFRRQHVILGFIADFYCHAARLVVEVDGGIHVGLAESDDTRDSALSNAGYQVLHVTNSEVENNLETVLARIRSAAGAA